MKKERLIWLLLIIALFAWNFYTINKYENEILERSFLVVNGIERKQYTAAEVKEMIKNLPEYQGDEMKIYEDGRITSSIPELDGGLNNAYNDPKALNYLKQKALRENLPLPFVVYRHVVPYYVRQHGDKTQP